MFLKRLFLGVCAAALTLPCESAVIFDNADPPLSVTSRVSPLVGAAAYLEIGASNVTIGQIAINAQPLQSGLLKFVIFSDVAPPGSNSGTLLLSDTIAVNAATSLSYIESDPLSFTLMAGQYYDIGAIFSGTDIDYTYDLIPDTENGITSIVSNQNVENFADPALAGHGAADINIQLLSGVSSVPEPGTFLLGAFGLLCAGVYRIRRVAN